MILREGRIIREVSMEDKANLTPEALAGMGLRSLELEAPDEAALPVLEESDEPMILRDFHLRYPGAEHAAVDFPELRFAVGEITAVTGSNGAGKTSFLNCLCGLEKRCKGKLEYKGKTFDHRALQKLCFMVMQDTGNQLFTESVLDEVLISLPKNTENEKERAKEILKSLDLEPFLERHPQSLSGGQKQRLAIACALASGREVLLLDEPTSGLDYAHMMETAKLLKQLKELGTTILVVTHDSELIHACCSRRFSISERRAFTLSQSLS